MLFDLIEMNTIPFCLVSWNCETFVVNSLDLLADGSEFKSQLYQKIMVSYKVFFISFHLYYRKVLKATD